MKIQMSVLAIIPCLLLVQTKGHAVEDRKKDVKVTDVTLINVAGNHNTSPLPAHGLSTTRHDHDEKNDRKNFDLRESKENHHHKELNVELHKNHKSVADKEVLQTKVIEIIKRIELPLSPHFVMIAIPVGAIKSNREIKELDSKNVNSTLSAFKQFARNGPEHTNSKSVNNTVINAINLMKEIQRKKGKENKKTTSIESTTKYINFLRSERQQRTTVQHHLNTSDFFKHLKEEEDRAKQNKTNIMNLPKTVLREGKRDNNEDKKEQKKQTEIENDEEADDAWSPEDVKRLLRFFENTLLKGYNNQHNH